MNKLILDEATVNDAAELEAEADKKAAEAGLDDPIDADKGQIESALNDALATAKRQMRLPEDERDWPAVLFIGEPGSGKAQPLTSKVYTKTGFKLMGDIKPGDLILDGKGHETKVLEVYPQGKREIYHINFDNGTFIEVADNHLNSVWRHWPINPIKRYENEGREDLVINTLELKKITDDKLYAKRANHRKDTNPRLFIDINKVYFDNEEKLPIDPYLLGCLLGDGHIHNSIGFTSADKEIVDAVDSILRKDWGLCLHHTGKSSEFVYGICNKDLEMSNSRKEASLFKKAISDLYLNVNSEKKFIPEIYKFSSYENRLALIQGLMDTDGTASAIKISKFSGKEVGGKCSFTSVSKQLADDVAFVLRSLGCSVTIQASGKNPTYKYSYKGVEEKRPCKQSFTLYINKPNDLQLFRLTRKLQRCAGSRFEPRLTITSVTFDRIDDCQCIYVESPEHTYLTDNLTLTHNTSRIKAWAKRHGINLYGVQASTMEEVDLNGPVVMDQDEKGRKFAVRLASVEFDKLERPNSVLFLDEFNRARGGVRGTLLTLINDHMIPDAREDGGMRLLKNMLFTVAAINPDETSDDVEPLGQAEHDRFRHIRIISDKKHWLKYIQDRLQHLIDAEEAAGDHEAAFQDERRKALITKLVSDKRFAFDETPDIQKAKDNEAWNKISLNNRNLTKLLDNCDGTKADFLRKWNEFCNNLRKPKIETILDDYEDIEDKANDVFKSDSESTVFGAHKKSAYEKLKTYKDNL